MKIPFLFALSSITWMDNLSNETKKWKQEKLEKRETLKGELGNHKS